MEKNQKMKEAIAVCRFYKGEAACPFDWESQNAAHEFWGYEQAFCANFSAGGAGSLPASDALNSFLKKLFVRLADQHMCSPSHFRSLYEKGV